ncbi:MAG: alpha/beta fold hydrolase [Anaerolineae bacterium]|nr:alpha/beta fold hydrolase [Anaerolineae bacterium]
MKRKALWAGIIIFDLLLVIYLAGSIYFADILIGKETQTLAESQESMAETLAAYPLPTPEEVAIDAGAVTLAGSFYDNPQDGNCAVLLLHGYRGTRYGSLQYAPLFWERGCDLLAYDARGHGNSSDALHTYGYHEKDDGVAAAQWLMERTGLPEEAIGLTGVSYGASTVLQMVPLLPDVAFVLADSPYQDLETIVAYQGVAQFGSWVKLFLPGGFAVAELRADFEKEAVSPKNAVADVDTPILITHSQTDTFTPVSNSEAIYANSNHETTWLEITDWGSPHAQSILDRPDAYKLMVAEFLATFAPDFGVSNGR